MDNKQKDQQLWQKIKAGDEHAFKILFSKYYQTLSYRAYKVYPDEHIAKDKVQEVFIDLWNKRKSQEIHTSVYAFLSKAVVFKTINHIRSIRLDFEKDFVFEKKVFEQNKNLEFAELKQLIYRTVESLPERCRIVFSMSRYEDMSHKEIASQLNISTKTVENQITKALKVLRQAIHPYLSDDLLMALLFSISIGEWDVATDLFMNSIV